MQNKTKITYLMIALEFLDVEVRRKSKVCLKKASRRRISGPNSALGQLWLRLSMCPQGSTTVASSFILMLSFADVN